MHLIWLPLGIIFAIASRFYVILKSSRRNVPRRRGLTETCHLAVFLGSGGHSSEALSLVSTLNFSRYTPRTYLISEGDPLSEQKAVALEQLKTEASAESLRSTAPIGGYHILTIPRARRVHQNILTVPFTALRSLLAAVYHVTLGPRLSGETTFDVLLVNGPGTCVVLCLAAYINRFFGLPSPRLVYVESFARVRALSLTGKLLRPMVDRFIVQWPDLLQDRARGEYHGILV
ncbi:oligosaccharide biosynthesis protein Alg14-like protein [Russula dissimulans]|nr:oligosaccharide biosynthesis protein Alg14-like protein [Russula dissimulans]